MAGKECCIAIDVALAMSGSEGDVESYYSVMKTQSIVGGQSNDTLVQRTNVDWSFPMPLQCQETIKDVATLYLEGDKDAGLLRHQVASSIPRSKRPCLEQVCSWEQSSSSWLPEQITLFLMRRKETQRYLTIKPHFVHIICEVYHNLALFFWSTVLLTIAKKIARENFDSYCKNGAR